MSTVGISLELPKKDVMRVSAMMERARRELGKSMKDSVRMGGYYITRSLSAASKVSPKLRPIVRNPNKRARKDRRFAPYGVYRWDKHGNKYFKPIYRTGEFGKVRFFDKKSMSWFRRDASNPKGKWESIPSGDDVLHPNVEVPGIMTDKRRVIFRRGMLKKSWRMASSNMTNRTMTLFGTEVARIKWRGRGNDVSLTIDNYLRHAAKGLRGSGPQAVNGAAERAANAMQHSIEKKLAAVK